MVNRQLRTRCAGLTQGPRVCAFRDPVSQCLSSVVEELLVKIKFALWVDSGSANFKCLQDSTFVKCFFSVSYKYMRGGSEDSLFSVFGDQLNRILYMFLSKYLNTE